MFLFNELNVTGVIIILFHAHHFNVISHLYTCLRLASRQKMSSPRPSDTVEPEPQRQSIDYHDERREERLCHRRQREKDRHASETAEQEARLAKWREHDRAHHALQSSLKQTEERNTRLERVQHYR